MIIKRLAWLLSGLIFFAGLSGYFLITTPAGLRFMVATTQTLVPGKLRIEKVQGTLLTGGEFDNITYDNSDANANIKQLRFKLQLRNLLWSQINFPLFEGQGVRILIKDDPKSQPLDLRKFSSPVALSLPNFQAHDVQIISPKLKQPFITDKITAHIEVTTDTLALSNLILSTSEHQITLDAKLAPQAKESIHLALTSTGNWQGKLELSGTFAALNWQQSLLKPINLNSEGRIINPFDQQKIHATIKTNQLGQQIIADLNADMTSEKFLLKALDIKLNNTSMQTAGVIALKGFIPFNLDKPINLTGSIQNVILNPAQNKIVKVAKGEFLLQGVKSNYQITANTWMQFNNSVLLQTSVAGQGDAAHITLNKISIQPAPNQTINASTTLTGNANVQWIPALNWQTSLKMTGLDPALFTTLLPGKLNFDVNSQGDWQNNILNASVQLNKLSGQINHQVVNGDLDIKIKNNILNINEAKLAIADNKASVKGQVSDTLALNWQVDAPHLEHFTQSIKGNLQAQGRLVGKGEFNIHVQGLGIDYDNHHIDNLTLNTTGTTKQHSVYLSAQQNKNNIIIKAMGHWQDNHWQGNITDLNMNSSDMGIWKLQNKVTIFAGLEKIALLTPLCETSAQYKFCLEGSWQPDNSLLKVNATRLPLGLFKPWLPNDTYLQGDSELHVLWQKNAQHVVLQGKWHIFPGMLHVQHENVSQVFSYTGGDITADMKNNNILANADLELWRQSRLRGNLNINVVDNNNPIHGNFKVSVPDLQWLQHWNTEIHNVKGQLQADLKVTGFLYQPLIEGLFEVKNASFEIPKRGITVQQIRLLMKSNTDKQFQIAGDALVGDGRVTLSGHAGLTNGSWKLTSRIEGDNVQLANTSEAEIVASPKLVLSYENALWSLNGNVLITKAVIKPRLFASVTNVSSDVVLAKPEESAQPSTSPLSVAANIELILGKQVHFEGFNLSTDVTGNLRIIHAPHQITQGIGVLKAKKGEYIAYGKKLTITSAQLVYTGNAIDNPGFDIRAERTIEALAQPQDSFNNVESEKNLLPQLAPDKNFPDLNNVQTSTVGIIGYGTLKNPQFKLFSNPTMPDADKLSYLLWGVPSNQISDVQGQVLFQALDQMSSSMGNVNSNRFMQLVQSRFGLDDIHLQTSTYLDKTKKSQSQTSVVLGKALSPRLFINYTIGLLDPVNILQITYKLTKNWSAQTDANNRGSSGGDIVYSIERN